jgi:hypothetical protein
MKSQNAIQPLAGSVFKGEEALWCSECDQEKVSSKDPKTGRFFVAHGHMGRGSRVGVTLSDEYESVYFALCCHCLCPGSSINSSAAVSAFFHLTL